MQIQTDFQTCIALVIIHWMLWKKATSYLQNVDPSKRECFQLHLWMNLFMLEGMATVQYFYLYMKEDRIDATGQMMLWVLSAMLYWQITEPSMKMRDRRIKNYMELTGQEGPYQYHWYENSD